MIPPCITSHKTSCMFVFVYVDINVQHMFSHRLLKSLEQQSKHTRTAYDVFYRTMKNATETHFKFAVHRERCQWISKHLDTNELLAQLILGRRRRTQDSRVSCACDGFECCSKDKNTLLCSKINCLPQGVLVIQNKSVCRLLSVFFLLCLLRILSSVFRF